MFRRKQPPLDDQPSPRDPLRDLAMTWRGRAATLNVANLRIGTHAAQRALNLAAAEVWMAAARQLETALKEES